MAGVKRKAMVIRQHADVLFARICENQRKEVLENPPAKISQEEEAQVVVAGAVKGGRRNVIRYVDKYRK